MNPKMGNIPMVELDLTHGKQTPHHPPEALRCSSDLSDKKMEMLKQIQVKKYTFLKSETAVGSGA